MSLINLLHHTALMTQQGAEIGKLRTRRVIGSDTFLPILSVQTITKPPSDGSHVCEQRGSSSNTVLNLNAPEHFIQNLDGVFQGLSRNKRLCFVITTRFWTTTPPGAVLCLPTK